MRHKGIAVITLLATLAWTGSSTVEAEPPKKPDLSGEWTCEGWNMGSNFKKKADYEITVVAEAKGNDTYVIRWKLANGKENVGVGIYDARTKAFAAGYRVGSSAGVAIYTVDRRAKVMTCVGTFLKKAGEVAQERWSR